jgi:hypothetical protein
MLPDHSVRISLRFSYQGIREARYLVLVSEPTGMRHMVTLAVAL